MGCLLYRKVCEASEKGCETEEVCGVQLEVLRCTAGEVPGNRALGWLGYEETPGVKAEAKAEAEPKEKSKAKL